MTEKTDDPTLLYQGQEISPEDADLLAIVKQGREKDPEGLQRWVKRNNPDIRIPELEIKEDQEKLRKDVIEHVDKKLEPIINKAKIDYWNEITNGMTAKGYTPEDIDKFKEQVKEKGFTDMEVASTYFEAKNPIAEPTYHNQANNSFNRKELSKEDLEAIADPNWAKDEAHRIIDEMKEKRV